MSNIKIAALITVKPEYTAELAVQFKELVRASRAEEGNISYDLHQEIGNPNRFVFFENWASQVAVDSHNASAHFQNFVQAIDGKTDALEIVLLNDVSI
ncbi:putative quinol monooxygenase [Neisseria animalis]|uniref:Antibiotic biosynthesis monooxygenase n=1 Tax=Neisseria animalis TaxID=492 RepID=A0A5P3MU62_NEIAN|nr:putative quinol monooxygenase [Neisseria animalis]QEY24199.1 antibiotic biosynthesis monooxygenase [Neisseria animalis]ROW32191.1 antibiotic biosynthesis monooxygenase [Neisseria animalis]VEE06500.1 antibiotic biosynthesis monooxygenase family protein [Neisseria animalis]